MRKEDRERLLLTPEEYEAFIKEFHKKYPPPRFYHLDGTPEYCGRLAAYVCQAQLDKDLKEILSQLRHGLTEHGMEFYGMSKKDYEALRAIIPEVKE